MNGLGNISQPVFVSLYLMWKILFTYSILVLSTRICTAQNLVANPSFEDKDTCIYGGGGIHVVNEWNLINYTTSPDYFTACSFLPERRTPNNSFGVQQPIDGESYAGIGVWTDHPTVSYRESVCGKFNSTLDSGKIYCISFYASLSDSSDYSIDRIGAFISDSAFDIALNNVPWIYDIEPSIENDSGNILSDTSLWYQIDGTYQAHGGEQHIIISNFRTNAETQSQYLNYSIILNSVSYYYIDQVSVEEIKPANAGTNQTINAGQTIQIGNNTTENATYSWSPTTGLSDPDAANPTAQPFTTTTYTLTKTQCSSVTTSQVTITVNESPALLVNSTFTLPTLCTANGNASIYDARGRIVAAFDAVSTELTMELAPGLYFLQYTCADGLTKVRRLVVQE